MEEYALKIMESGLPIPPSELYTLTLPEINAVVKGYNTNLRKDKIMFGTVTAAIYNSAFGKKNSRILRWSDIFPDDEHGHHVRATGEELSAKLHAMFGGGA